MQDEKEEFMGLLMITPETFAKMQALVTFVCEKTSFQLKEEEFDEWYKGYQTRHYDA